MYLFRGGQALTRHANSYAVYQKEVAATPPPAPPSLWGGKSGALSWRIEYDGALASGGCVLARCRPSAPAALSRSKLREPLYIHWRFRAVQTNDPGCSKPL